MLYEQFPNIWNVFTNKNLKTSLWKYVKMIFYSIFENYTFTPRKQRHVKLGTVLKIELNNFLWKYVAPPSANCHDNWTPDA